MRGFTLVELTAALVIAGFVLLAATTLGTAMGRGNDAVSQMGLNQAMVRYTAVAVCETIRNGLWALQTADGDVVVWREDANGDRGMNGSELTYLIADTTGKRILLAEFPGAMGAVTLADVQSGAAKSGLLASAGARQAGVVKGAGGISLGVQGNRLVTLRFNLAEETGSRDYEVCAAVRGSAMAWLNGGAFGADDD